MHLIGGMCISFAAMGIRFRGRCFSDTITLLGIVTMVAVAWEYFEYVTKNLLR